MTRRTGWLLLLMSVVVLCLTACSKNEAPTTTAPDTTPQAEESTPAAETTPTVPAEETPPAAEPQTAPEAETPAPEGAFSDAATALDALASYRYSTLFTFVGEEDGEIQAGSIELTGIVAGPDEKHLVWRDLGEDDAFEVIQIGDRAWIRGDEGWEEAPILVAEAMTQAVLIYAPSVAWGGMFGELESTASYVGTETVNGVSAKHYTSTYQQWGSYWAGSLQDASGDVWIAEAGYPVKYQFAATGIDQDGDRGTVTWRMDLTDVNSDLSIEPPL